MKINDLDIIVIVDVNNDIDKKDREEEEEYKISELCLAKNYKILPFKEKDYYEKELNSDDIDIETWTLIFEKKKISSVMK